MSRKVLTTMLLVGSFHAATLQAVEPSRLPARTGKSPAASIVLPRLQRGPNGEIIAKDWKQSTRLGGQTRPTRVQPSQTAGNIQGQRVAKQYTNNAWKRGAQPLGAKHVRNVSPRTKVKAPSPNRVAGKFRSNAWKRGGQRVATGNVRNATSGTKLGTTNAPRLAKQFNKNTWKRGANRFKAVHPKSTTRLAGGNRVATSGTKKFFKRAGTVGAVVGGAGLVAGAVSQGRQLDADLRAGRITQAQYSRAQATNALNVAGGALAIKKMNPASMAMNVAIGTDPISLGVDAVGDVINGTNNAERSVQNVGRKLEGHAKGVKKLATDPRGWTQEAGRNVEKTAKNVGKSVDKTANDVGKFVGGIFGRK